RHLSDQVLRRRRAAAAREPQGLRAASRAGLAQRRSRALHPDAPMYTFYMRKRWERDAGLRLDQILLSSELAGRLVAAGVDRLVRGEDNASDHTPVLAELRDPAEPRAVFRKPERASQASIRSKAPVPSHAS